MMEKAFPTRTIDSLLARGSRRFEPAFLARVQTIVEAVREEGVSALARYAARFDGVDADQPLFIGRCSLQAALDSLPVTDRERLERAAARITAFAGAQRSALRDLDVPVPGGRAGHSVAPVERAGCYAPGGRHPLPSSVLMTALTARAAGVETVWVASPRPLPVTLAAAALAGADGLIAAGGAHAIAALAFGAGPVAAADIVVGPGNRYVTAAKQLIAGLVGIDMLAGPSELAVVAGAGANPALVAADLLAQAEHDPDALPVLVALDAELVDAVRDELAAQLVDLPTRETAAAALANGGVLLAPDLDTAIAWCDALAPEHLELCLEDPRAAAPRFRHYGALFVGEASAEVFGDYGAGPNHVLPTGGAARLTGGLSVLNFLRVRTWLALDQQPSAHAALAADAAWLARVEGLEAHARAAERRCGGKMLSCRPRTRGC